MSAIDVTDANFEAEVINRSMTVPVVVDLWAEWCNPCKILGPIIERVVDEKNGDVALVKIDVDANPEIAGAFKVQSIPAVYAIKDGKVVDGFVGAQPEATVRAFVDKLVEANQSPADVLVQAGDEEALREALTLEPGHEKAIIALSTILIERGENEEALGLLSRIPESEDVIRLKAMARLGGEGALSSADATERLTVLLELVKDDEDARQEFRDLLEVLPDRELATKYRRAMAARLF